MRTFKVGDRVVATFTQGRPPAALGSPLDGVLAEFVVFDEDGLLKIPAHLSFEEAATLPCAGVTVWNALMHGPRCVRPGDTVLTLGTGGVSIFALQLAKIAGARVIITSSSDAKLERARALGADTDQLQDHPDWEKKVLELTDGQGADARRSTRAARHPAAFLPGGGPGGTVELIGVMTRPDGDLSLYPLMTKFAMLRGIFVGTREHFEGLARAVAVNRDETRVDAVFEFDQAVEAFKTSSPRSTSARS